MVVHVPKYYFDPNHTTYTKINAKDHKNKCKTPNNNIYKRKSKWKPLSSCVEHLKAQNKNSWFIKENNDHPDLLNLIIYICEKT